MSECAHKVRSPEAYVIDVETGEEHRATVWLCSWPDQHPDRFINAPRWLLKLVGPGLSINPDFDCVGCPGFTPSDRRGR